ncbi:hypothetical protein KKB11_05010 [Candidatus Micrarchaeota archaeon]|nr:hypothetical protein [Candidatus Micrarchaeota archaeon]
MKPFRKAKSPQKKIHRKYLSAVSPSRLVAIKKMAKPLESRRVVVHLGNVDDIRRIRGRKTHAAKTAEYSQRFTDFKFIGIDAKRFKGATGENWNQMQDLFKSGLERLPDNHADIISSEMALGYYGSKSLFSRFGIRRHKMGNYKEYTKATVKLAREKLKKGGKLMVACSRDVLDVVTTSVKEAGFDEKKIQVKKLTKKELGRTNWTQGGVRQNIAQDYGMLLEVE